ncbi:MAG: ATP-binding protein [Candidatus Aminicenantes bacterium]|nr:ATP-binding protein [Candidatus Aminicenantes bacterium]
MKIHGSGVRRRLTLWYTLALALIVLVFSLSVYVFVKSRLFRQLDQQLDMEFSTIAGELTEDPVDTRELDPDGFTRLFLLVRGNKVLFRSEAYQKAGLPEILPESNEKYRTVLSVSGKRYRSATATTPNGFLLTVALGEEGVRTTIKTLFMILALALPIALALAALGGYVMAGRLLKPVAAMAEKADKIGAENLSERLPVENPEDEFGKLAGVFNRTLARLQDAFERLQRFTADASHELRTPLTALQSVGEVALQENLDVEAYRDCIGSMLEETARLTRLVESLLLLTRADSGRLLLNRKGQNVTAIVEKAVDDMRVMAEEKNQNLSTDLTRDVQANIDEDTLRRAVVNILDNAIKFTPQGGAVAVRLKETKGRIVLEVEDSGSGISPEHREKIFDRFYRVDQGRSRDAGGAGLGLAIAKWAVEANGGRLELESREPHGSTFRIVLMK